MFDRIRIRMLAGAAGILLIPGATLVRGQCEVSEFAKVLADDGGLDSGERGAAYVLGESSDCNANGIPDENELDSMSGLLVSSKETDSVIAYHGLNGEFVRTFTLAGLDYPNGIAVDGNTDVYVASAWTDVVIRFSPRMERPILEFSGDNLDGTVDILICEPSTMLVGSWQTDSVVEFDLQTAEPIGDFVKPASGGLDGPEGLLWTEDGNLLVVSQKNNQVLEFDGQDGSFVRIAGEGCGLNAPAGILFDDNGNLLVSSFVSDSVIKFAPDASCLGEFVSSGSGGLDGAQGMAWGPNGNLFVCSRYTDEILEYNRADGSFVGVFVVASDGGLIQPTHVAFTLLDNDCNENGVPDDCDIADGKSEDCNVNSVPDECDLGDGASEDCNKNGVPDECDPVAEYFVDDDAPGDPGPGDPSQSDPEENGSPDHPYDALQEAIDAAVCGGVIVVADGIYTGQGNRDLDFGGRVITLRSENGPQNCIIDCQRAGRGFYFHSGETAESMVQGFTIRNGEAPSGGGIECAGGSPTISDCTIVGNKATQGGGMNNDGGTPTVINCTFRGNWAVRGGGMNNEAGDATVINCRFVDNVATGSSGGGIYNSAGRPTVTNCTFSGNSASAGGGITSLFDLTTVTNCILWGNTGGSIEGLALVTFSDVEGGFDGEGNIDADPLFVPGPIGCRYLGQTTVGNPKQSPCVDAGSDTAENLGLDSLTTRSDEVPDTGTVDMGYHFPVTGIKAQPGDSDADGDADLIDFGRFQDCFTGTDPGTSDPCCCYFDFEPDGDVDLDDFVAFQLAYTGPG